MTKNIVRITFTLLCLTTSVGCVQQISVEKALTEEYLSKNPDLYAGNDRKLRAANERELNQLFLKSFKIGNIPLAQYYLSIGANLGTSEIGRVNYIRELSNNIVDNEYRDLLFESLSQYPDMLYWDIKRQSGNYKITALTYFALYMSVEDFRKVVSFGVDVDYLSESGCTTLADLVVSTRHVDDKKDKIKILLEAGADPSISLPFGRNILHYFQWWPIEEDYHDILEVFQKSNLDFNKQDESGSTPLHMAVYPFALATNSPEYARFLLANGAKKDISDDSGWYPADYVNRYERNLVDATPEEVAARKEILQELFELLNFR